MAPPAAPQFQVHAAPEDAAAAERVQHAARRSLALVKARWGLEPPADLGIYLMTSWQGFLADSAPPGWKALLALTRPLWQARVAQTWSLAGGWEQRYGRCVAVGIKPPHLLAQADRHLGERIFLPEDSLEQKMETIACHELTHACSTHLRLPSWLKEGLAMLAVDHFLGRPSVRPETRALLRVPPQPNPLDGRRTPRITDEAGLLYLYAHGYWLVRWLDEQHPDLLRAELSQPRRDWDARLASILDLPLADFHREMDARLA